MSSPCSREFSCSALIVVVAIVPIVAIVLTSCGSTRGGALAVRDDLLHPREETLHPCINTRVLGGTPTAIADNTQKDVFSILSNSKWTSAVTLASIFSLSPSTKTCGGGRVAKEVAALLA